MQMVRNFFYALNFKLMTIFKKLSIKQYTIKYTHITTLEFLSQESLPHLSGQFDPDSEVPTPQWEGHGIFYMYKKKRTSLSKTIRTCSVYRVILPESKF